VRSCQIAASRLDRLSARPAAPGLEDHQDGGAPQGRLLAGQRLPGPGRRDAELSRHQVREGHRIAVGTVPDRLPADPDGHLGRDRGLLEAPAVAVRRALDSHHLADSERLAGDDRHWVAIERAIASSDPPRGGSEDALRWVMITNDGSCWTTALTTSAGNEVWTSRLGSVSTAEREAHSPQVRQP
jgi:hypothetical protein